MTSRKLDISERTQVFWTLPLFALGCAAATSSDVSGSANKGSASRYETVFDCAASCEEGTVCRPVSVGPRDTDDGVEAFSDEMDEGIEIPLDDLPDDLDEEEVARDDASQDDSRQGDAAGDREEPGSSNALVYVTTWRCAAPSTSGELCAEWLHCASDHHCADDPAEPNANYGRCVAGPWPGSKDSEVERSDDDGIEPEAPECREDCLDA